MITDNDKNVLRELGRQVAEIAGLPVHQKTITLWKALNSLKPEYPMAMIDQIPWHEMDVDGELTLRTEDDFCRGLESGLRRILYSWKHIPADMVVEAVVRVPKVIRGAGFGITTRQKTAASDPLNGVVGHLYFDQIKTEDDIQKIRNPEILLDEEDTAKNEAIAHEIFDGVLDVRMAGSNPGFAAWDSIVQWRSPENMLYDLIDRPEFMHKIMSRLTEAMITMLDQLEDKGLLGPERNTIHCSGSHNDELPAPGFNPDHYRAKDLWTSGMAQIFSTVSPAMHKEFELDYANEWYSRFGLVYYGCCEPLHEKIDIIRSIPHVRKISMSPWVDEEKGAERIGPDFVYSRKPSPAFLATETWDADAVKKDLQNTYDTCTRHGCPFEFILKDISTVKYQPQRLWEWSKIARDVARQ